MVTDITIAFLFTTIILFIIVTNVPMVTFTAVLTRVTSVYWLLLCGCTRSVSLCGHFLLINFYCNTGMLRISVFCRAALSVVPRVICRAGHYRCAILLSSV